MLQKFKSPTVSWILSFLCAWFTTVFLFADRGGTVNSLVTFFGALKGAGMAHFCILILSTWGFHRLSFIREKRRIAFSFWGAAAYALCLFFGFNISCWDSLWRPEGGSFGLLLDLSCLLGSFLLFFSLLLFLFDWLLKHPVTLKVSPFWDRWMGDNRRSFILSFLLLMAIYTLFFLFYYPGVVTQDSSLQIAEAIGIYRLSDVMPYVHTLIMSLLIKMGMGIFGTRVGGIAFYTVVQMILIALSVSYVLHCMARRGIRPCFRILTLAFFALHPVIGAYAVSVWKDIWLSYFIMIYALLLTEIAVNADAFFLRKGRLILLTVVSLGVLFCKNTGMIVFLGTLPFLFVCGKRYWKKIAAVAAVCLVAVGISRTVVMPAFGIGKGRVGEPLSAPLQQIARTCAVAGNTLTEEQKAVISEILPLDELPELYDPQLSDAVKGELNDQVFSQSPGRYLKCWAEIGITHPRIYLESLLANSYGYWYPEMTYTQLSEDSYFTSRLTDGTWGIVDPDIESYGFRGASPSQRHYLVYLFETVRLLPGVRVLLSVAFYFWGALLLALIAGLKKRYRLLLPLMISLLVFVTCILSPVVAECRYAFPALLILPVILPFVLQDEIAEDN